jgi:hypothetical protein
MYEEATTAETDNSFSKSFLTSTFSLYGKMLNEYKTTQRKFAKALYKIRPSPCPALTIILGSRNAERDRSTVRRFNNQWRKAKHWSCATLRGAADAQRFVFWLPSLFHDVGIDLLLLAALHPIALDTWTPHKERTILFSHPPTQVCQKPIGSTRKLTA